MTRLAFRNLFQNKIRLLISVGGVALALLLILTLDAIFTGVEKRLTIYIDNSGADVLSPNRCTQSAHGFIIVASLHYKEGKLCRSRWSRRYYLST
jgi:putative ABC transport system permease protein